MQFTDTLEMIDEIQYAVERHVQGLRRVSANELGLDIRCGRVYIDRAERVIVSDNSRSLDYYGGFEYIDKECRTQLGDYVIYQGHSRVDDCFDCLEEEVEDAE